MSLKLYLSGASTLGGVSFPVQSLGLYPSSEEIQNEMLGNLFGDLSRYTVSNGKTEYRAIALQNDSSSTPLTGLKAWIEYPVDPSTFQNNSATIFEIGFVALTMDSCGDPIFPSSVKSIYTSPYSIDFDTHEGESNALVFPELGPELIHGMWIKRKIKPYVPLTDDQLAAIANGTLVLPIQEDIKIHFSWD